MTPFESKPSEPNEGDEVIVCPHVAAGNDVGEIKYRYQNPPTKQITKTGQYLRANWSACCQSCYATAGGDADKIQFVSVATWPVEKKKDQDNGSRRGPHLKEGEKVAVCEHLDSQHPGRRRSGGGIFWLEGKGVEDTRVKKETHQAVAIVLCELCGTKFARDPDSVRTGGVGEWKDESGIADGNRVAYLEDVRPETDWPPSEESLRDKKTVADVANENPKAETGQRIEPPPPGVRLADSVTDPKRDEEQRHVMGHGGGGLPPIEESPPRDKEEFVGEFPVASAVTDHEAEKGKGFEENRPAQPQKGDKVDSESDPKRGKRK